MMKDISVVLFKAEKTEAKNDPYFNIINNGGMKVYVVPTLSFNFINEDLLQKELQNVDDFIGMILTSNRAVEAVHKAFTFLEGDFISEWKKRKNYCVGESTSKLAGTLLQFEMLGEKSGNSEELCNYILSSDFNSSSKSFLFPCSNIRKETIPKLLTEKGYHVVEIVCYETVGCPYLKDNWQKIISQQGLPDVLVFFSPSGVQYSREVIRNSFTENYFPKYVALGPSTEKSLIDANMTPCVVANKPNPESVFEAICNLVAN